MYAEPSTTQELREHYLAIQRRFFPHLRRGAVSPAEPQADQLEEQASRAVELLAIEARRAGVEEYQHDAETWDVANGWDILVADVCERHMVTFKQILQVNRKDLMSAARRDLVWLAARFTRLTYVELSERMQRHRTNILSMIAYEDRRRHVRAR